MKRSPEANTLEAGVGSCDADALARLRKWGGEKLVRDMLRLFRAQVFERVAAARNGIRTRDAAEVERAAHALKSSCGQLGAVSMQALCAKIEAHAQRSEWPELPAMLLALEEEHVCYLNWLANVVPDLEESR